jgi:hypothetical protein
MATVAGFLGYVNYREPWLGKALDYLLAAGLQGPEKSRLEIVMPEASPPAGIAVAAASRLSGYAEAFFGRPVTVTVAVRPAAGPELKIFPVESSKAWNQIAFFLRLDNGCEDHSGAGLAALVIAKKGYRELVGRFSSQSADPQSPKSKSPDPAGLTAACGGEFFRAGDLAEVVDRALPRAREKRGIVHLVTLCRSRDEALTLDYAAARLKEYGTPGHEGPLEVRTLLGRLHVVFPGQFCTGLFLLHRMASH